MADFNPDAYLAQQGGGGFDPDSYLGESAGPMTWGQVGKSAASHLGTSAGEFATNLVQPILHPIQTAENLYGVGHGALQKAGAVSGTEDIPYADAVKQFFSDRYGGMEAIKHTLATDPVGVAADLSTLFTGGEGVLGRFPGMVGRVGEASGMAARAVDPMSLAGKAAKKVLAPGAQDADTLARAGVQMTPGQMTGGLFKHAEDLGTSVPVAGSFIKGARERSVESFNKAVADQALAPIGERLDRGTWRTAGTEAGHDLVDEVATKLGSAYDRLAPRITWQGTPAYANDLNTVRTNYLSLLSPDQRNAFEKLLDNRIGPNGLPLVPLNGQTFKKIESELTQVGSNYSSSAIASERDLGRAINGVTIAMREDLERTNPAVAAELKRINTGWAMYSRIRGAAGQRGTSQGIFTPSDLLQAIKKGDRSVGKGSFAKGDALMQSFAETGQRVLPSKTPTSGTAERGAFMAALGYGAYHGMTPEMAAVAATASAPYSRLGISALNRLRNARGLGRTATTTSQIGRLANSANPYAMP